jgi:hypothetical protein
MSSSVDARIEAALVRAEKMALSVLSPRARAAIILLKSLSKGRRRLSEVREECMIYGFRCSQLEKAVKVMEAWGLLECGDTTCSLTEDGRSLAQAISEFSRELREYLYSVIRGVATDLDTFSYLATPMASIIGVLEAVAEEPESISIALVVHTYVSALAAAALSQLARIEPKLVENVRRLYGGEE